MAIVGRIAIIMLAYALACVAASLVVTLATLTPDWDDLTALGLQSAEVWSIVAVGAAMIGASATLPALIAVILTEGFAWRSIVVYAAAGGVMALALGYRFDMASYVNEAGRSLAHDREVLAAAGIAGGLIYWLVAGRRAGAWKRRAVGKA